MALSWAGKHAGIAQYAGKLFLAQFPDTKGNVGLDQTFSGSFSVAAPVSVRRVRAEPWQPCVSPRGFAGTNEHPPC